MTFSCIIIDDDLHTIEQLTEYISQIPQLHLLKSFTCPIIAVKELNYLSHSIDFLFTDVEMPGLTGLELISQIKIKINCLILVSGHLNYAVEGYEVNAKYFLGKPFDFKKFEKVVNSCLSKIAFEAPSMLIKLSGKNHVVRLQINDILLIEGASNYIKIHTKNKIYVPYVKMSFIENELKPYKIFRRISKSFIISSKQIEKIEGYHITLKNNLSVSVGKSYRTSFDSFLIELLKVIIK